jgi:hypothetical protein
MQPLLSANPVGMAAPRMRSREAAVETLRTGRDLPDECAQVLSGSLAQLGRIVEGRQEVEMFLVSNPHFTISHGVTVQPVRDVAIREHFVDGFRKASLP